VYETGEWPRDFIDAAIIDLKKAKGYKIQWPSQNQPLRTYSKIEKKPEGVLGDQFGIRRVK